MRHRSAWVLVMTPVMALAGLTVATASQAAVARPASMAASHSVQPNKVNQLDCNGYSSKYKALDPGMRVHCTDPFGAKAGDDRRGERRPAQPAL